MAGCGGSGCVVHDGFGCVVSQCGHLHGIGVAIECYGQDAIVLLGYFGFVVLAVYLKLEFFHI